VLLLTAGRSRSLRSWRRACRRGILSPGHLGQPLKYGATGEVYPPHAVDLGDHDRDLITNFNHILNAGDAVIGELTDMN